MSAELIPIIIKDTRRLSGVGQNVLVKAQDVNPVIDRINALKDIEKVGDNFIITESSGLTKNTVGIIYTQTSNITVANTTTETSLLTATTTFPANFFSLNKQVLIRLRGFASRIMAHTVRIRIKLNSTVIFDSGATAGQGWTNNYFDIDTVFACRAVGTSGAIRGQGFALLYQEHIGLVNTSDVTIDTTVAQTFDITWEWGTADPGNTVTATNGFIKILK